MIELKLTGSERGTMHIRAFALERGDISSPLFSKSDFISTFERVSRGIEKPKSVSKPPQHHNQAPNAPE